jgi:IMP dehydrogenase
MRQVRDIVSRRPRVVHKDQSVAEVAGILDTDNISGAPLIDDDGKIVGVISKSDINHLEFIGGDPLVTKAWEIGRSRVVKIELDATVQEAAQRMLEEQVHRLIVVDDAGELAGVITSFDFVRIVAETLRPPSAPTVGGSLPSQD